MSTDTASNQPWHVPDPSPWPIVGTIGAFVTAVGLIWFMQTGVPWALIIGGIIVVYTMMGWWREVIKEASDGHSHTRLLSRRDFGLACCYLLLRR